MKKNVRGSAVLVVFCQRSLSVAAADVDGNRPVLCATFNAHACDPGITSERSLPAEIGALQLLRLDFSKKTVTGAALATPMLYIEKGESQFLLLGTERAYAWSIVLDSTNGAMSATLVNRYDALVLFGALTPN
ncbi:conserved exported hypothetical protein [Paraburkholderia ribeironis]|uniref:Uncharacterized protein n=1 Tax=Paraburkholderia ribeironis TaxID=1247936 RepID=A0A1N7RSP9_9BURK|nr:hypothetical protein [Paraburkholderia ribeironis]SIT38116.1 conserved exported hypothetical protein [Paraburkholderia ribeironis]